MSEHNQQKITFKVRERDSNDYKLPLGMSPELSQALQDVQEHEKKDLEERQAQQDIKQTKALKILDTYEESVKRHQKAERKKVKPSLSFFQLSYLFPVFLLLVFIQFFLLIRMLNNFSKESRYSQAVNEEIRTQVVNKKEIDPDLLDVSDVPKVERIIKTTERIKEKELKRPKESPKPHADENKKVDDRKQVVEPVEADDEKLKAGIIKDLTNMMDSKLSAKEEIEKILTEAFSSYPQDLDFHAKIVKLFITHKHKSFIYEKYARWTSENPDSYAANMISGILLAKTIGEQEQCLKNACTASSANPQVYPYVKLLELYETAGAWKNALSVCDEMILLFPDDVFARVKKAEVTIYSGEDKNIVYSELKNLASDKPLNIRLELLLPIAQDFMEKTESEQLINTKDIRTLYPEIYQYYSIRHSLIFDTEADSSVLHSPLSRRSRNMLLLYHLSHKQFSNIMQMTTPPDDYPDFAKVFVNWYNGNPKYLPDLQTKLLNKNSGRNVTVTLLCRFWQNEITAEQLRSNLQIVPTEDLCFVYIILAEDARRKGREKSADVLLKKANQLPRNVFTTMLRMYK